jgi:hypothetical protein
MSSAEKVDGAMFSEKANMETHTADPRNPHVMPGSGDQVLSKYTLYETKR